MPYSLWRHGDSRFLPSALPHFLRRVRRSAQHSHRPRIGPRRRLSIRIALEEWWIGTCGKPPPICAVRAGARRWRRLLAS
jgi:hypothetical protein